MRTATLATSLLIAPFFSCTSDPGAEVVVNAQPPLLPVVVFDPLAHDDLLDFDIVQRTCAMYFAVKSAAFETPLEFGRDVDDSMVHWNKCPGGNMVACAVVPTAHGDSIVGIPFPY